MLLVLTSPRVLSDGIRPPDPGMVQALKDIRASSNPVGLVSNHDEPAWFQPSFAGSGGASVAFVKQIGRQSGEIVSEITKKLGLSSWDTLVLAGSKDDVQMGKNGGAVLIAAGWSTDRYVTTLGIQVRTPQEFKEVVDLSAGWDGGWWHEGQEPWYSVRALCDLSGFNKSFTQVEFASRVTNTVKGGGPRLLALLTVTARSLLKSGYGQVKDLMWGVYPSSSSSNDDTEILSDFTHRLRTTVSAARYAKRSSPLFIRHTCSSKRSKGGGGDRTDPAEQIQTLHLNPEYQGKVVGRNVIVIDDCTTYGVSFGVAAAYLRKAGAASVSGIALGKFGNQLRYYEIEILTDPFAPVAAGGYKININHGFRGATNMVAQNALRSLIR